MEMKVMKKSLNIAHRGFSGKYPENTMRAFIEAVKAGCDGIETDLHMTKDGVIVLCHDESIDRTTNNTGYIAQYDYKDLCKVDAGIKFGKDFINEKIPSLDEFFEFIKDKNLVINLELKNNIIPYKSLEEKVIHKIYEYKLEENVILSSFNHYSMVRVKEIDNNIKTGLLYFANLYNVHDYALSIKADAVHPFYRAIMDENIVRDIKNKGIMINTYTVNEETEMESLISLGVEGIITNYPDRLKKILNDSRR
jgi:glycerophosphoryl diester phosphodiesterase